MYIVLSDLFSILNDKNSFKIYLVAYIPLSIDIILGVILDKEVDFPPMAWIVIWERSGVCMCTRVCVYFYT